MDKLLQFSLEAVVREQVFSRELQERLGGVRARIENLVKVFEQDCAKIRSDERLSPIGQRDAINNLRRTLEANLKGIDAGWENEIQDLQKKLEAPDKPSDLQALILRELRFSEIRRLAVDHGNLPMVLGQIEEGDYETISAIDEAPLRGLFSHLPAESLERGRRLMHVNRRPELGKRLAELRAAQAALNAMLTTGSQLSEEARGTWQPAPEDLGFVGEDGTTIAPPKKAA